MPKKIIIITANKRVGAELNDSKTANLIWDALPIKAKINRWGDEVYFKIPVKAELDDTAKEVVEIGELGFWPTGSAFCIFFGMTPISDGRNIIPASAVNIVGKVLDDPEIFKESFEGDIIRLEAIEE